MTDPTPTFGVCLPNFRPGASPEAMAAAIETAERLGWGAAWTTDHVLIDDNARGRDYRVIHEALLSLAWAAARSERIRLGISVLVVPMRNAVILAKELATIDSLSHGRLIAGVGIGWNRGEFENLGVGERFGVRGAFLEETVALWRYLWGGGTEPYEGRFDSFGPAYFGPLPPQGAELPIWIGAHEAPALRRIGRIAEGYQATSTTPAGMVERAAIIREAADAAGRPMPTLGVRVAAVGDGAGAPEWVLSGGPDEMITKVRAYAEAGVADLAIDFRETDADALARAMERFDEDVVRAA